MYEIDCDILSKTNITVTSHLEILKESFDASMNANWRPVCISGSSSRET